MPPGRKTKLTCELQEALCAEFEKGKTVKGACGAVGLGVSTYYDWRTRGENAKTNTDYKKFCEAVDIAMAKGQTKYEDVIYTEAIEKENWHAAAWYLERRDKPNFAKQEYYSETANDLEDFVDPAEEDRIFKEIGK